VIHSSRKTGLASGVQGEGLAAGSVAAGVIRGIVRAGKRRTDAA
jgi:hypothetical protein